MTQRLITLMIFLPFLGAILQAFLPASGSKSRGLAPSRWVALGASLASSLCGIVLVTTMRSQTSELQANEIVPWLGSYAISYDMGMDGLNVLLILLVAIIFPLLIASEWNQKMGMRGMHGLLLILQSSLLGTVCSQDLFILFFFWALSALPFYFLIGIWGGGGRESAAFRFIVASAIGNALFFAALVLVYYSVDPHTFSLRELAGGKLSHAVFHFLGYELPVSSVAFALIGGGLALRSPIWPFHGWFTQSAEEAPPSVFVALSAVSVPVAAYMFVRLAYSLFSGDRRPIRAGNRHRGRHQSRHGRDLRGGSEAPQPASGLCLPERGRHGAHGHWVPQRHRRGRGHLSGSRARSGRGWLRPCSWA